MGRMDYYTPPTATIIAAVCSTLKERSSTPHQRSRLRKKEASPLLQSSKAAKVDCPFGCVYAGLGFRYDPLQGYTMYA